MTFKKITSIAIVLTFMLSSCSLGRELGEIAGENTSENSSQTQNQSGQTEIQNADLTGMDFSFSERDNDTSVTNAQTLTDSKITSEGCYTVSGNVEGITVAVKDTEKVQLVLDGVNITTDNAPAIFIESADKVFITLKEGSENTLSDGSSRLDTTLDGVIFSRADLTINGNGALKINANYKHGIVSKDDLVITGGKFDITSLGVGLCGKDCVKLGECDINVVAGSDGVRSDNTEESTRGYIFVDKSKLNITASNDGLQAETAIKIADGDIQIASNGDENSDESYKGIKATSDIIIENGNFNINTTDDCLHSNNTITINGGVFNLSSQDDGIHADNDLAISNGKITVLNSYEGLESSRIIISGGNVDITASDDGLNAAGGNDLSQQGGMFGKHDMFSNGVGEIKISGGYTLVNASGDGIDSNGTISVSGGITLVSGPENNGNGAFDCQGNATVTGGTLVALGSSGMASGFTDAQNQGAILVNFTNQTGNTPFAVLDSDGKVVVSFTPKKNYSSAVVTSPNIQSQNTYTFVSSGKVSGADANGFAQDSDITDYQTLLTVELTDSLYSMGGGMRPGGTDRPQGNPPNKPW